MQHQPNRVVVHEEGPREGFQIEKGPISTAQKVALVDALSATGLGYIQVASFVSPKRVPGMADAAEIVQQMTPKPGIEYTALWFNDQGFKRARATGRLVLRGKLRGYPSPEFLQRNLHRTAAEHMAEQRLEILRFQAQGLPVTEASISSAWGCNFHGSIGAAEVLPLIQELLDLAEAHGVALEQLSLADTMAWATPNTIKQLVGAVQGRWPDLPLRLHLHDTRGMGVANAYAGLEMGVRHFDTAVAGLGGCPFAAHKGAAGNLCTEDFVFLCDEMGLETGIDLEALIEAARLAEQIVGHPLPGSIMQGGSLARLRTAAAQVKAA